ncbi:MAG TPA: carboxypeptidase-like regulatory domain-containing protein [Chitinophagaceae bacterium]|jgi:CarboxypepD_reg-like domain|nr:carboxypeptidase-like regulatory domain-containing protein [Chitinophagaceae bacterium]
MKKLLFLLLTFSSASLFAQQQFTASGKIIDSATNLPLAGASVFCQNTTLGNTSNSEGAFKLDLPNGGYDLIISYTGYETQVVRISVSHSANLLIALKQKDKSMQEISIVASNEVPDGLAKYGKFFMNNFIGNDTNAALTKIQNPEALQFYYRKKTNRLKVKAKEDLIIINEALGYKIKFALDSFAYDYGPGLSVFTGFPFFEELPGTDEQKIRWRQNRQKAYNGSRLHFIRSWYTRNLEKDGFHLEKVDSASKTLKTYPVENPYDSSLYRPVENSDIEINYNGRMRIVYNNALPDPQYLKENKMPELLRAQISILDISDGFVIEQNGYFYDQNDVINIGYWSWEKLSDELPYDYIP